MNPDILYILGAGRSGSTVLATILSDSDKIQNTGELHHFFSYVRNNEFCSCGQKIYRCEVWGKIIMRIPDRIIDNSDSYESLANRFEYHSAIPNHLIGRTSAKDFDKYKDSQDHLFRAIYNGKSQYILDSAKYIGRYLALTKIFKGDIKGIYLVRDVRGVIWSFKKKVQTQNNPMKTLLYYILINSIGQIITWVSPKGQILKLRYEDLADAPEETLEKIGQFLDIDFSTTIGKIKDYKPFQIPHIIGGNRLKTKNQITLQKDVGWIKRMPITQKIVYYFVAIPLMLINKYKLLK